MEPTLRWHDDDLFWESNAAKMFTEQAWANASLEIERVLALSGLQPGAAMLDLGCGPGRHSLELGRRGFAVTGVDRTAAYLEIAQKKAAEEGLQIEFVQADMRTFRRPEAFDGAVSLFTTFGYFEDPSENARVLANLAASLKPGGRLVMDMAGKEVIARIFLPNNWQEQDGVLYLEERKISQDWSWIENRWIVVKDGERRDFVLRHWLYSGGELRRMLLENGFSEVKIYGSLEGIPYDNEAKRLVAVAMK